jgi:hypothetical protein
VKHDTLILVLCFATLGIALAILAILVSKRGKFTPPDAAQIEAMRLQNSHEHSASERMTRDMQKKVTAIHERFGFLSDAAKPEPPGLDTPKDDMQ